MYSIISRLVVLWFFVGWGLIAHGLGFVGLASAIAFFSSSPANRPNLAVFMEAACEIEATVTHPSTIGLESRALRAIAIGPDGAIDFRALPDRWRYVCLTEVGSGGPDLPTGYGLPRLRLERPLCSGWSPRSVTALLVAENGATFPFQMNIPDAAEHSLVSGASKPCSPVNEAVARCGTFPTGYRSCAFALR